MRGVDAVLRLGLGCVDFSRLTWPKRAPDVPQPLFEFPPVVQRGSDVVGAAFRQTAGCSRRSLRRRFRLTAAPQTGELAPVA